MILVFLSPKKHVLYIDANLRQYENKINLQQQVYGAI